MEASRSSMVKLGEQKTPGSSWDYQLLSLPGLLGSLHFALSNQRSCVSLGVSCPQPSPHPCHISPPPFDTPLHTLAGLSPPALPGRFPSQSAVLAPAHLPSPAQRRLHGCSAARSPPPRRRLPKVTTPQPRSQLPPPARAPSPGTRQCPAPASDQQDSSRGRLTRPRPPAARRRARSREVGGARGGGGAAGEGEAPSEACLQSTSSASVPGVRNPRWGASVVNARLLLTSAEPTTAGDCNPQQFRTDSRVLPPLPTTYYAILRAVRLDPPLSPPPTPWLQALLPMFPHISASTLQDVRKTREFHRKVDDEFHLTNEFKCERCEEEVKFRF